MFLGHSQSTAAATPNSSIHKGRPLLRRSARFVRLTLSALLAGILMFQFASPAQALSWNTRTTGNGLGSNWVNAVFVDGSTVYAATDKGLSISTNGGATFTNKTTANGLGNNSLYDVYATGGVVYVATMGGISFSTDGGDNFTNKTYINGLGCNAVNGVFASGGTIYAATSCGLSISTNGGTSFVNRTPADGLGGIGTSNVFTDKGVIYVGTSGGLSISTNDGLTFTNRTTANGLGANSVTDVLISDGVIYAGTNNGVSISTNDGLTFTYKTAGVASGLYDLYVSGGVIYAAAAQGVFISTDGGNSFSQETAANGLGNSMAFGVHVSGSTLYAGTLGGLSIAAMPLYASTPAAGSAIDLGKANLGSSNDAALTIGNNGAVILAVTGFNLSGANAADFSVTPPSVAIAVGGAPQTVTIRCTPSSSGLRTATLSVTHNGPGGPPSYALRCTGLTKIYLVLIRTP